MKGSSGWIRVEGSEWGDPNRGIPVEGSERKDLSGRIQVEVSELALMPLE